MAINTKQAAVLWAVGIATIVCLWFTTLRYVGGPIGNWGAFIGVCIMPLLFWEIPILIVGGLLFFTLKDKR